MSYSSQFLKDADLLDKFGFHELAEKIEKLAFINKRIVTAAEQQIQNEIKLLQEQLAFSREIKRKKELFKETQNKKIEALKSEIKAKTLQYNLEIA